MNKPKGFNNEKSEYPKWSVYFRNFCDYGDGRTTTSPWELLGETRASSAKKAINNVKYRTDTYHYSCIYHEWAGDGMRTVEFKAEITN